MYWASQVLVVKRPWERPMQETQEPQVWFLGWEDPLEKGLATHSSILAWRTPWIEEPGRLQSIVLPRVGHDWSGWAHTHACNHASDKHFLGTSSVSGSGPRARAIDRKGSRSSSVGIYISGFQLGHDRAIVFSHAPTKIWQCLETLSTVKSGRVQLPALNAQRPLDAAKHPVLQSTGQPPQQRIIWRRVSLVLI